MAPRPFRRPGFAPPTKKGPTPGKTIPRQPAQPKASPASISGNAGTGVTATPSITQPLAKAGGAAIKLTGAGALLGLGGAGLGKVITGFGAAKGAAEAPALREQTIRFGLAEGLLSPENLKILSDKAKEGKDTGVMLLIVGLAGAAILIFFLTKGGK